MPLRGVKARNMLALAAVLRIDAPWGGRHVARHSKTHTVQAQNDRTDRCPARYGERHQGLGHGRRAAGEFGASRHADGHGRRGHRAVLQVPEVRRLGAQLARSRPLRPVGRPRLDAALFAAASHRLRRHDPRRAEEVPPARRPNRRPSRVRPCERHRDDDRPAGPGPRQLGGLRAGRACAQRALRPRRRRPLHLRHRRRRLPDGRHRPGSDHAGRPSRPRPPDRAVRRQRHLDRRPDLAVDLGRPDEALRRRRLARPAVDGHDAEAVTRAIRKARTSPTSPR